MRPTYSSVSILLSLPLFFFFVAAVVVVVVAGVLAGGRLLQW